MGDPELGRLVDGGAGDGREAGDLTGGDAGVAVKVDISFPNYLAGGGSKISS